MDLEGLFDELDKATETSDRIIRAPFGYPGGKQRSLKHLLPLLPYTSRYIEPFGGSAAVLLGRNVSKLEVFNDRYAGVVAFYRCIRDERKIDRLIERLDLAIHSREEWTWCAESWENCEEDVERAARWYYMTVYSFSQIGRNFGRSIAPTTPFSGKHRNTLQRFPEIHRRFKCVQVENQDWFNCMMDYDHKDTVFYIDPPYIDAHEGAHKHIMTHEDHRRLIDTVFSCEGFCAVSGYDNPIYTNNPWDNVHEWESFASLRPEGAKGNSKDHILGDKGRTRAKEVLWIKEARR